MINTYYYIIQCLLNPVFQNKKCTIDFYIERYFNKYGK
jgi:hypothetical protein